MRVRVFVAETRVNFDLLRKCVRAYGHRVVIAFNAAAVVFIPMLMPITLSLRQCTCRYYCTFFMITSADLLLRTFFFTILSFLPPSFTAS